MNADRVILLLMLGVVAETAMRASGKIALERIKSTHSAFLLMGQVFGFERKTGMLRLFLLRN